jgi:hypothetical protein
MNLRHTNKFPKKLVDSIASIFAEYKINSSIEGGIAFLNLEEV